MSLWIFKKWVKFRILIHPVIKYDKTIYKQSMAQGNIKLISLQDIQSVQIMMTLI